MPVPLKSINSACAFCKTSNGNADGPALKLNARLVVTVNGKHSLCNKNEYLT